MLMSLIIEIRLLIYLFLNNRKIMQESSNQRSRINGRWTQQQHLMFLQGLRVYGKNWKKIESLLKTRTGTQIRSHAQKFFMKLEQTNHRNEGGSQSGDFLEKQSLQESAKLVSAGEQKKESSSNSYYFNKILQHSTYSGVADFWNALVDLKHHSTSKQYSKCKHSFEIYSNKECHLPLHQLQ